MSEKRMNDEMKPKAEVLPPRRRFFRKLWLVLGGVALAELAWVVVSFFTPRKEHRRGDKDTVTAAGRVDDFIPNSVTAFPRGAFYLVRLEDGGFLALSRRCTHLGCTVPWSDKERRFVCPCHSSVFDISGAVVSPPAPRALDLYRLWIENDSLFVDTGRPIKRAIFDKAQVVYRKKSGVNG